MTPGTYLRLRREAAGKSIEEVALLVHTDPPRDARYRADYIDAVERDNVLIDAHGVLALHEVFPFDRAVLVQLIAIHVGGVIAAPDICLHCGCSWNDPCHDETELGCGWRTPERDWCTACPDPTIGDPAAIALPDRSAEPLPGVAAIAGNFDRTQRFAAGLAH